MTKQIGVVLTVQGFHHYPDAPDQVDFLKHKHRHLFKIECVFEVDDLNRELEFFIMRDKIKNHIALLYPKYLGGYDFGAMSCEMIAAELFNAFGLEECTVTEDNESWGRVKKDPQWPQ